MVEKLNSESRTFEEWKQRYAPDDSGEDYDLLAAFHSGIVPDASGHWKDLFKKPNHPTFSVDSVYAVGADAAKAGHWDGDTFIPAKRAKTLDDLTIELARELYDRFVMGGWEPEDAHGMIREMLQQTERVATREWSHKVAVRLAGSLGYGGYIIDDFEAIILDEIKAVNYAP